MRCHASLGIVVGLWCCWTTHDLPSLRRRCTVDIDRDPPKCLDAQGGIKAERQPFVAGVGLKSCGLGRGVVVHIMSDVGTVNTCTPARLEALFTSSQSSPFVPSRIRGLRSLANDCAPNPSKHLCRDLQCCAPRGSLCASPLYRSCAIWQV